MPYMRPEEFVEFDIDEWAYKIDPALLEEIKQIPDGPECKTVIKELLNQHLPEAVRQVPPAKLAELLGPDVCEALNDKTRKYKQNREGNVDKKKKKRKIKKTSVRNMPPVVRASIAAEKRT